MENAVSVDEARKITKDFIKNLPWKEKNENINDEKFENRILQSLKDIDEGTAISMNDLKEDIKQW
jgi:hypothetical protein